MPITLTLRRLALAFLAGAALVIFGMAAPATFGGMTPAHAQVSGEFQAALQPYGAWRRHARWGQVWVPAGRPRGWRPYTYGHWIYTDEWGWYWISDREEEDWGWVTFHYGRWVFDRGLGWFWVRGDEWAPAWVNWRRGGDAIGWAPLPPEVLIGDYEDEPALWIFVSLRDLTDARVRTRILPPARARAVLTSTVVVNRTLAVEKSRIAVNAGIAPAIVGAAARASIQTYRVAPRVIAGTQGVTGAVAVKPQDLARRAQPGVSRFGVSIQRMSVVKPAASVPKPEPLAKGARGLLGAQPPRAAQGAASAPPQQKPMPPPSTAPAPRSSPAPVVSTPPVSAPPVFVPPTRRVDEPPPQAKPIRPIVPQTPPPPPPQSRSDTKTVSPPKPPAVAKPAPPRKPGEKREERN